MAEDARHERRHADIAGGAGRHRADVAGKRNLRDVEFLELEGAVENLLRIHRQIGDVATLDLHPPVADRARAVVIAACNRYRHVTHCKSSLHSSWPGLSR